MEQLKAILFVAVTLLLVWFSLELDLFAVDAEHRWIVWLLSAILFLLPLALAVWVGRSWSRVFVAATAAVVCIAFSTPWHVRKQFVADLRELQPGDSLARVNAVMSGYTRLLVGPPERLMFRHSDKSYDVDAGFVYLKDGRVSRVEFFAD